MSENVKNHTPDGFLLRQVRSDFGVSEYRSIGLDVRRARETMWLQLMCCTLSNLSLSKFTRADDSYGIEGMSERTRRCEI